ncbi:polyprenyl synthetase family protein [Nonomuraea terrae]|uniref:polyprenyl synthetase family protein n=1 Tax=Nonomuraea terrae TaxID=2530383 RepID=UPI001404DE1C|nr:polyprenyl synthetase family protein [Nonomuraea terrae]
MAPLIMEVSAGLTGRWTGGHSSLDSMCSHALVPSGKMFRPILVLESALAVGGDARVVLPAAMGAESGHVASLVHDDIIDDDEIRRGKPSVQHQFGVDNAIVAGDALIFDLFLSLAECRKTGAADSRIVAAFDVVARRGIELCRGQIMEAEICERMDFDREAYLTMAGLKTASLFKGACECGALLGGGDDAMVEALSRYAENLGIAFQIHDDLLSYTRETGVMGKPDTSDVRNGRLTLPVILAYELGDSMDRLAITDGLSGEGDPTANRQALITILERTGALAGTERLAAHYSRQAVDALAGLPVTLSRERLARFAEEAIDRDR